MTYYASVNIENGLEEGYRYYVTPNVLRVYSDIVSGVQQGSHSFSIIGNYGTGKSSFLMALEVGLRGEQDVLVPNREVFFGRLDFEIMNVVADYRSLRDILADRLSCRPESVLKALKAVCMHVEAEGRAFILVLDEFGKVLEHAAAVSPDEELYFIQQVAELFNDHKRKAVFLSTLHQNFGAYSSRLTDAQRSEWQKVKGRFREVVFNEPVEQLLFLAAEQNAGDERKVEDAEAFRRIYDMASECRYVGKGFSFDTAVRIYPLDPLSAQCLTVAIQRYGQNERSLFSFLTARGNMSLHDFHPSPRLTYSLADVYDYLTYYLYSSIADVNIDSSLWSAIRTAVTRVENGAIPEEHREDALKIVKAVGLLNTLASPGTRLTDCDLCLYSSLAMGVENPDKVIKMLEKAQVIRYASYKSKYILFEGTDMDIGAEMKRAGTVVSEPIPSVANLAEFFREKVVLANASFFKTGTPRYYRFILRNEPEIVVPEGDIDGFCELVVPLGGNCIQRVKEVSRDCAEAILFAVFKDTSSLVRSLHEVHKVRYLLSTVAIDDKVAHRELSNILSFELDHLDRELNAALFDEASVEWFWRGKNVKIGSRRGFNAMLSQLCSEVYPGTPVLRNELFNRQKVSSAVSFARCNYFDALVSNGNIRDLGFLDETFPPEKTCYMTLLKETGIHRTDDDGMWVFGEPSNGGMKALYDIGMEFIESTRDRPRKVSEFLQILRSRPFKLKQGLIDFWLPTFLFIRQQDFALYSGGAYVPQITREVIDLMLRRPSDYQIKAFNVEGVRLEFFRRYREFLRQDSGVNVDRSSFSKTYIPFLQFYRRLDNYAKRTRKFDSVETLRFRDTLASASDPEKAFFEDIPEALGYKAALGGLDFVDGFVSKIRACVRELNQSYASLISRLEESVMTRLGLQSDFASYKVALEERYSRVKRHLLSTKARQFLDRVLTPCDTGREFMERTASIVLDARLENIRDEEEETLVDNMVFLFHELDRCCGMSGLVATGGDKLFGLGLTTTDGTNEGGAAWRLPESQRAKADELEARLEKMLSGDKNLDACVLLQMLEKKLKEANNG